MAESRESVLKRIELTKKLIESSNAETKALLELNVIMAKHLHLLDCVNAYLQLSNSDRRFLVLMDEHCPGEYTNRRQYDKS